MSKGRNWCFTINNPQDKWRKELKALKKAGCGTQYIVAQLEQGKNGTKHIQGYVQLSKQLRLTGMKKIHGTAHWEVARGKPAANIKYCTKKKTRISKKSYEWGTVKQQGRRVDLEAAVQAVEGGERVYNLVSENPQLIRLQKHLKEHKADGQNLKQQGRELYVEVRFGASGSGKSLEILRMKGVYQPPLGRSGNYWWDGYNGEEIILLDEFYGGHMPFHALLKLLDREQTFKGDQKGITPVAITPKKIYITSNGDPADWYNYNNSTMLWSALKRRINKIIKFEMTAPAVVAEPIYEKRIVAADYSYVTEELNYQGPVGMDFLFEEDASVSSEDELLFGDGDASVVFVKEGKQEAD